MGFTKTLVVVSIAHVVSYATAARAGEHCPEGPFETDVHVIAASIAAQPLEPPASYTGEPGVGGAGIITDGVFSAGGGGLGSSGDNSTSYDAKRYVVVSVTRRWPSDFDRELGLPGPVKPNPNQLIRKVGDTTSTTTVARPTPDDARELACLANRLLTPRREQPPVMYEPPSDPRAPPEVTVIAHRNSGSCSKWFSDAHWESFSVVTSRPGWVYNSELSCTSRDELEGHIGEIIDAAINDVIEQGAGSWQPPRIHSVAVDATDNLYLFVDSGTHRRRRIDIRKVTPSGEVTRLYASVGEQFYGIAFTVTQQGQAWAPSSEPKGTVIYALSSARDLDAEEPNISFSATYPPQQSRPRLQTITADANENLYAMDESDLFKITPSGTITVLTDWGRSHPSYALLFEARFHLVAADDGKVFVADSSCNVILRVTPDGTVSTVAGSLNQIGTTDGRADRARFHEPKGLALDHAGNLYVADSANHTIRRISTDGRVSTFAGRPGKRGTVDGRGKTVRLDSPTSIAIDSAGVLYVTNGVDNLIRKISPTGVVSTVNAQRFIDASPPDHSAQ